MMEQGSGGLRESSEVVTAETLKEVEVARNPAAFNSDQKNPMMNDVILKLLFEKSSPRQLNQYRLVCKHWYNVSLPVWLSSGPPLTISCVEMLSKFMDEIHGEQSMDQQDVTGIQRYPKFHLEPSHELESFSLYNPSFESFLNLCCGPFLTHLTLRKAELEKMEIFRGVLLCAHTPNLKFLDLNVTWNCFENDMSAQDELPVPESRQNKNLKTFRIDWRQWRGSKSDDLKLVPLPVEWKFLFEHYPNLQHLGIGATVSDEQSEMMRILQAIIEIRSENMEKLALKSLNCHFNENHKESHFYEIMPVLPSSFPDLLRQANLVQLEEFRFDFSGRQKEDFVHSVLSLYADTLTKLEVNKSRLFEEHSPRDFPHLRNLTLTGFQLYNLKFMKELPNLCSLRLFNGYMEEFHRTTENRLISTINEFPVGEVTFPSLSNFCCNYLVDWTAADLTVLQKWFPNLSRLELCLDNVSFRLVCQHWPNLEHLSVYGAKVGDKGIAGLKWEEDQQVYQQPNITSLQKLRSFAIEDLGLCAILRDGFFSHHSLYRGFLKLPNLERLVIQASEMDSEVRQLILDKIPFARVIIRNIRR